MTVPRPLGVSLVVFAMIAVAPLALEAQTAPGSSQETSRLTLVIEPQLIRFTTPGEALDWRLEISDPQGQPIFDSAFVTGRSLNWALVDAQGQPVASGVYEYTVTIKRAGPGGTRTHRGQLAIERASPLYQISAAGDETIGGTSLTVVTAGPEPPPTKADASAAAVAPAGGSLHTTLGRASFSTTQSGTGTTFHVSKWIDGPNGVLGDTHITEENGSVVVGDGSFRGNLQIFGSAGDDVFAGMGPDLIAGPGFNYGYAGSTFGRSAGFFNVRPDGSATPPNPSLRFMTANVQRMIITNIGNVGIGTSSPSSKLDVVATGTSVGVAGSSIAGYGVFGSSSSLDGVRGDSTSGYGVFGSSSSRDGVSGSSTSGNGVSGISSSGYGVYGTSSNYAGYFVGNVYVTGTVTQNSDVRLKHDVAKLGYGLREVLRLRPVTWTWKDRSDRARQLGLIAQDVEPVIPELVTQGQDDQQTLGLNYIGLVPVVIKAIQEQQATITALRAENAALKARVVAIEQALASMGQLGKKH